MKILFVHRRLVFIVTMLIYFLHPQAYSQACCTSAVPAASNQLDFNREVYGLSIRLDYDHNFLNDLIYEREELEDDSRKRVSNTYFLSLTYMLDSSWGVSVALPFVDKVETNTSLTGNVSELRTGGLSDISAFIKWQNTGRGNWQIISTLGVKIPTGIVDEINEENGILYSADLQPGTGSWDFLFAVEGVYKIKPRLLFNIGGSYTLTTPADRFDSQISYKFGNTLQILMGAAVPFVSGAIEFLPFLNLRSRFSEKDQVNDSFEPNTGGFWLNIQPGVRAIINNKVMFSLIAQAPVYRNLTGVQLSTSYRFQTGVLINL